MRIASLLVMTLLASAQAESPSVAIEKTLTRNREALAAQQQIDALYQRRLQATQELQLIRQEGSAHAVLHRQLEQQISEIHESLADIRQQAAAVSETQTGILRLLTAMVDALDRFISLDLPFDLETRSAHVATLRANLSSATLSVSEKYQTVVAAYLKEIQFGSTNAVTQQTIETPLGTRLVQVLRLGRAGLWYVSADGTLAGYWDPRARTWTSGDTDPRAVLSAIRMLAGHTSPQRIQLPVRLDIS